MGFAREDDFEEPTLTIEQIERDLELETVVALAPVLRTGKEHDTGEEGGGVVYQRCGGGRRVLRKRIGG